MRISFECILSVEARTTYCPETLLIVTTALDIRIICRVSQSSPPPREPISVVLPVMPTKEVTMDEQTNLAAA